MRPEETKAEAPEAEADDVNGEPILTAEVCAEIMADEEDELVVEFTAIAVRAKRFGKRLGLKGAELRDHAKASIRKTDIPTTIADANYPGLSPHERRFLAQQVNLAAARASARALKSTFPDAPEGVCEFTFWLDEDDHFAVSAALAERQSHVVEGGIVIAQGLSDFNGACLGDICRHYSDAMAMLDRTEPDESN